MVRTEKHSYHHNREKERKKRKRRDSYDDYEEEGGISGWKLGLVVGVIVVCFAMLYPTLFHPMLMGFFGRGQPAPSINQQRPPVHPAMGGSGPRHPGGHPSRPDVHPAMRMAQAQAESQSGGTKGMFTWMLPVYTIGVVLFLLYTLFKSKKKDKKRRKNVYFESEDEDDSDSERETKYGGKFGKKKLRGLQERLRQTEDAMAKILEQLESVQAGANPVDLDAAEDIAEKLEDDVSAKQAVGLTETNEQYIKDLEIALKEFQTLSAAYDNEKKKKLRRDLPSSEDEDEEEEENEGSSEMSEIEEEEKEDVKGIPRDSKKKTNKIHQRSTSEEEEDEQLNEKNEESDVEEEGIDIDSEIREQEEREKKEQKILRKRRAKKT